MVDSQLEFFDGLAIQLALMNAMRCVSIRTAKSIIVRPSA